MHSKQGNQDYVYLPTAGEGKWSQVRSSKESFCAADDMTERPYERITRMAMTDIIIRQETVADIAAINVVNISAFEGEAEAKLVTALRQSKDFIPGLSLVADIDGRVVGHILLSRIQLQYSENDMAVLALAPMAVMPSQSHRGIGSALVRAAITKASSMGERAIMVIGRPSFYAKFDFAGVAKWKLHHSLPVPSEAVQTLELLKGGIIEGGVIHYSHSLVEFFQQANGAGLLARHPE